jgi:hypothetical protein
MILAQDAKDKLDFNFILCQHHEGLPEIRMKSQAPSPKLAPFRLFWVSGFGHSFGFRVCGFGFILHCTVDEILRVAVGFRHRQCRRLHWAVSENAMHCADSRDAMSSRTLRGRCPAAIAISEGFEAQARLASW